MVYFVYDKYSKKSKSYVKYDEFGIFLPTKYKVHGIDVSHYQGKINWKLVSEMKVDSVDIDFVFIKATEGVSFQDKNFNKNWKGIKEHKMIRGAYHYFKPKLDGKRQAKHFCNIVKLKKGDLPPVIDIEETQGLSSSKIYKEVKEMADYLENQYQVKPIIYTYHDFYKLHFKGKFDHYPIWIAHYNVQKPESNLWNFWQLSDKSRVSGIHNYVDFNVFNRDLNSLKRLLIK